MSRGPGPTFIAHRAGNSTDGLRRAAGVADVCELDVHLAGADLEVRHAKRLWPGRRLWERWYLLPTDTEVPTLDDLLAAAPPVPLWFDLKGVSPRLARRMRPVLVARAEAGLVSMVSSKSWWLLAPLTGLPGVRTMRSAGNLVELALLRWLPTRARTDGAVVRRDLLTSECIRQLRARGELFTWRVSDPADLAALIDDGSLDGFIVDDLSLIDCARSRS